MAISRELDDFSGKFSRETTMTAAFPSYRHPYRLPDARRSFRRFAMPFSN